MEVKTLKNFELMSQIKIALYARKSVIRDTSISVELQINNMKDFFLKRYGNRCEFIEFKDDGYSGKNTNRPDFKRMISLAKYNSFDIIAAYKCDRIARNTLDFLTICEELKSLDTLLISTSESIELSTSQGEFIMKLFSIIADWESGQISQRVTDSLESLAKLGCFSGGDAPTGYILTRLPFKLSNTSKKLCYLQLDPDKKDLVYKIFTLSAQGYSNYYISKKLNIPTKTIANIIANPTYVVADAKSSEYLKSLGYSIYGEFNGYGFLPYNRRCKKNGKRESNSKEKFVSVSFHEPIVSSDMWIAANENVKSRGKEKHPRISTKSFLAHLPKCICGSGMFIHKTGSKTYFRCSAQKQKHNCDSTWLRADELEDAVLSILKEFSLDKSILEQYCNYKNSNNIDYKAQIKEKKKEITRIETAIYNLKINLRAITGSAAKIIADDINDLCYKKESIEGELATLEEESLKDINKLNIDILYSHIKWFISNFDNLAIEDKHIFAKSIISKIQYNGTDGVQIIF